MAPPDMAALKAVAPRDLAPARILAHHAVQWLTRATRAALPARDDDSHSNLGWIDAEGAFGSRPLGDSTGNLQLALRLPTLTLAVMQDGAAADTFPLSGRSDSEARSWVAEKMVGTGIDLDWLDAPLPYMLEDPLPGGAYAAAPQLPGLSALAAWYGLANRALEAVVAGLSDIQPGPSPVRCWPHHFDIATLVSLEEGDPESARSIGVGLSPGDMTCGQPYLYVTPWPAPDSLPDLGAPGRWHTQGFVSAVLIGDEIAGAADPDATVAEFLSRAVSRSQAALQP